MGAVGVGGASRPSLFDVEAVMPTYLMLTMPIIYLQAISFKHNLKLPKILSNYLYKSQPGTSCPSISISDCSKDK